MAVRKLDTERLPLVQLLSLADSDRVRQRLVAAFVDVDSFKRQAHAFGTAYWWDHFSRKTACQPAVLSNITLRRRWLTIYFHNESRCLRVRGTNVAQFVKKAWDEDADFYVFDDSYEWCVAFTHEDVCVLTGQLPNQLQETL